jgi:ribosomal-protein-alanine N-acetyltransferase
VKGVTIRHMHRDHLPEVIEIERSSFGTPWSELSFLNEIYNPFSRAYVALIDTTVAGYIVTKQVGDEGHILDLAVHPEHRGQRIAKFLVAKGLEDMRQEGTRHVYLEVRLSNRPAIRLYEGLGFRSAGVRKSYYIHPLEDALVMVLDL